MATTEMQHDGQLGWAPTRSADNPLGIISRTAYVPTTEDNPILFFGDSFVEGTTVSFSDRIPQLLDPMLPDRTVYNYGVGGYGVDQICLRLKSSHGRWSQPFVLIGILTSDLDRCVLRFRGGPKPYFDVHDGALLLRGVPVTDDKDQWIAQHPLALKSYLLSFLSMRYRLHQPGPLRELELYRQRKTEVNRLILDEMASWCRENELSFCFVLFYEPDEFEQKGWREDFLLQEMEELQVDYIDTKSVLLRAAEREQVPIADWYQRDHHLNGRGNRVVAEAVRDHLTKRFDGNLEEAP